MDCLCCRTSNVIASRRRSNPFLIVKRFISHFSSHFTHFTFLIALTACSEFFEPVDSTPAPTEYSYNYWLLQRTYLFEDELPLLDENGDSVQELYSKLSDPFTRYVLPSKSEATITQINTSVVPGDVGLECYLISERQYPVVIYRVYPNGPAGLAGVPKYGNILNVNGTEITGPRAQDLYDSVLRYSKDISMRVAFLDDTTLYEMSKEDVYAPTVFLDTAAGNIPVITITGFKLTTADQNISLVAPRLWNTAPVSDVTIWNITLTPSARRSGAASPHRSPNSTATTSPGAATRQALVRIPTANIARVRSTNRALISPGRSR